MEAIALPQALSPLSGQLIDTDSHEMMPAQTWVDTFGSDVKEIADAVIEHSLPWEINNNSHNVPDYKGDVMEITQGLLDVKGPPAPGAFDLTRRVDVMDAMGVAKQLMYPTGLGGWSMTLLMQDRYDPNFLPSIRGDRSAKALRWLRTYNDWFLNTTSLSDRIRPVPTLVAETVEELMAELRRMLDAGIRAVMLPASIPPGGRSPAHPDLDPFWDLLSHADCVPTLHLGSEGKFFEPIKIWRDAPIFEGYRNVGEFSSDPWYTSMVHLPAQNFIQTMVTGGVFQNYPRLRLGVIELGAYWAAPMMRNLDMWHSALVSLAVEGKRLPEKPSEYIKRHIRFSVFPWEDLARYVDEGLEDIICFATDYPHLEGGRDSINEMVQRLEPCGWQVMEKFFVRNAEYLFPE